MTVDNDAGTEIPHGLHAQPVLQRHPRHPEGAAAGRSAAEGRRAPERAAGQSGSSWPRPSPTTRRSASASCSTIRSSTSTCSRMCRKAARPASRTATARSWAIYGNAKNAHRDDRIPPRQSGERGERRCWSRASKYALRPGQTRAYGPNVIHSTAHPQKAWVIRVTGTDLDKLPRYHFRKQDRVLEKA